MNRRKVPAAAVRVEDRSTVEDRLPRNSCRQVCCVFVARQLCIICTVNMAHCLHALVMMLYNMRYTCVCIYRVCLVILMNIELCTRLPTLRSAKRLGRKSGAAIVNTHHCRLGLLLLCSVRKATKLLKHVGCQTAC